MSSVFTDDLLSPSNNSILFVTRPQEFTTAQLRIDSLIQFNQLIKSVRIENQDSLNNLTYRTQSPSSVLKTVAPNSADNFDEWTSYLEINPNAVSGVGLVEFDLVERANAINRQLRGRIPPMGKQLSNLGLGG